MAQVLKITTISEEHVYLGIPPTIPHANPIEQDAILLETIQNAFQQGVQKGIEETHAMINEQETTLKALIAGIPQAICDHRLHLTDDIADIVMTIAQQFFIHQQHHRNDIVHHITQALTQLNHKQNIELILHPDDLIYLQENHFDTTPYPGIQMIPDETLRLGGCVIRSEHGVFNASIERQVDSLKRVLLQIKNQK